MFCEEVIQMLIFNTTINEVIKKMNEIDESYITGGYLRDFLLGSESFDVDIVTKMPLSKVKELYPTLYGTENGLAFGVGRMNLNKVPFEFSSILNKDIKILSSEKDFTMNSLLFDGKKLIDNFGGTRDIESKVIRSLEEPQLHFEKNPQAYLRAIRFSGQLGFSIDPLLLSFLMENKRFFSANNVSRIQQEGYKIIRSPYPLNAINYLHQIGLLTVREDFLSKLDPTLAIPIMDDKPHMRLVLLTEYVGIECIHELIDVFQLSKQLKEQIDHLLPYLKDDVLPTKPYLLNTVISLKRLQYHQKPDKFQEYISKIKKQSI